MPSWQTAPWSRWILTVAACFGLVNGSPFGSSQTKVNIRCSASGCCKDMSCTSTTRPERSALFRQASERRFGSIPRPLRPPFLQERRHPLLGIVAQRIIGHHRGCTLICDRLIQGALVVKGFLAEPDRQRARCHDRLHQLVD